jgi:hypothetical protein
MSGSSTNLADATFSKESLLSRADFNRVPEQFRDKVCRCSGAKSYCNPTQALPGTYDLSKYPLEFEWWVCSICLKPSSLNTLNARIFRECELCEEPYMVNVWPDTMNICQGCLASN